MSGAGEVRKCLRLVEGNWDRDNVVEVGDGGMRGEHERREIVAIRVSYVSAELDLETRVTVVEGGIGMLTVARVDISEMICVECDFYPCWTLPLGTLKTCWLKFRSHFAVQ